MLIHVFRDEESLSRFFKNRGISVVVGRNAYEALDSWIEGLDDDLPCSADFCAKGRLHLVYRSGTGRTEVHVFYSRNGGMESAQVELLSPGDSHWAALAEECEAAEKCRQYSRYSTIQREWGEA